MMPGFWQAYFLIGAVVVAGSFARPSFRQFSEKAMRDPRVADLMDISPLIALLTAFAAAMTLVATWPAPAATLITRFAVGFVTEMIWDWRHRK